MLRVVYRWAVSTGGANTMHLFWGLEGQACGKSMCGRVIYDKKRPLKSALFVPVCERCRDIGVPGHPLPRGMI